MRKRKEGWKLDGSKGERGRERGGREERDRRRDGENRDFLSFVKTGLSFTNQKH